MTEIAIALDVPTLAEALALERRLPPGPEVMKIGLQLYTAAGPESVETLARRGRRVFLDLKLHDIPNTVQGAAAEVARLGADLVTVHATGGEAMIRAAVDGIAAAGGRTEVVAVTVLTSLDPARMPAGFQQPFAIHRVAAELLAMAERAGAKGIVCSPADLAGIRAYHPRPFFAVTPGIRPAGAGGDDQRRVTTIGEAVALGAGMVVVGRPITAAADPAAALEALRAERDAAVQALARS